MGVCIGQTNRHWGGSRDKSSRKLPLDVEASVLLALSVAVMAPALTEGGPQKPENLLPSLPSGGFLTSEQAQQVCQNREILAKFVVSANVQPSKIDDHCLRGIPKDLIRDVINSKYVHGFETLSTFVHKSDLIKDSNILLEDNCTKRPLTIGPEQKETDFIMNDPALGDREAGNMGFLKTNTDLPLVGGNTSEIIDNEEDKNLDVNQIMAFGEEINNTSEQCNVSDLGQNVEDILQVIKSIEGAENVTSSNNEIIPNTVDSVEMFPISEESFSFDRDLFPDVDVMSLCTENVDQQKSNNLRLQQSIIAQKQFDSERRSAFLLRRLRKLQARMIGKHIAEENTGILELAHEGVKKHFLQELVHIGSKSNIKSFPEISSNLNLFLQKIEKMCIAQSNSVSRQRFYCRYFGGGSRDTIGSTSGSNSNRQPVFGIPQIRIKGVEVENVAGPLATQLHVVESNLDSDCTASSSGGESCDEMQSFNNPHQQHLPM